MIALHGDAGRGLEFLEFLRQGEQLRCRFECRIGTIAIERAGHQD